MGWFAKRRTPRTLSPVSGGAMIERYDGRTFAANDVLCIPAGWEALWVSGGAFSRVFREGDDRLPIEGRREVEGDLYFIRLAPEETFAWGCGGVRIGERTCGLHGSMRLEVASSRKLLSAFIGEDVYKRQLSGRVGVFDVYPAPVPRHAGGGILGGGTSGYVSFNIII